MHDATPGLGIYLLMSLSLGLHFDFCYIIIIAVRATMQIMFAASNPICN